MSTSKKDKITKLLATMIVGIFVLSACTKPTPEVVEKLVTQVVKETVIIAGTPEVVEQEVTKIVEVEKVVTATPETKPGVGGTLVFGLDAEPDTLDVHKTPGDASTRVMSFVGASLVARNPATGQYVPYLAESWKISEDGTTWDFTLKQGVKFHDGTPLTAHDYAWTFQRAMDPATQASAAASLLGPVASVEAVDDYTLRITLNEPFFPFLNSLVQKAFLQPLPRAVVEELGDLFGRQPIGVGPYKFKEWQTGDRVILERNPDFNWGPPFTHGGPAYVEIIEWRIIPEYATVLAGMESGEIDCFTAVEAKDVQRLRDLGFQIFEVLTAGLSPAVMPNVTKPPLDDVRLRKALNLAVDRESLVRVAALGSGVPQWGPISPSVAGYWPGVEEIGYGYDVEQAKALLLEAGYTVGADGLWEKDGQPLKLTLKTGTDPVSEKVASILQEQYKALGLDVVIEQTEGGLLWGDMVAGNYELALTGITWGEVDMLYMLYHSSMMGALNLAQVQDPELDKILEATRITVDPDERQEWANAAQKHLIEMAYSIPLYAPTQFSACSSRVKGDIYLHATLSAEVWLDDGYLENE